MKKGMMILMILAFAIPSMTFAQEGPWADRQCRGDRPGLRGPGCDGPRGDHKPGAMALLRHSEELKLSEEQIARIEELQLEFKMQGIDQKAEIQKARVNLKAQMRDEDAVDSEVVRAIDEVSRLEADMHKARYMHRQAMKDVLTDEQADQLKELRTEKGKQFKQARKEFQKQRGRGSRW